MLVGVIIMVSIALIATVAYVIFKQWVYFQTALDILTFTLNQYLSDVITKEEYDEYKNKVYNNLNFLQRYWLRRLKGGSKS